MGAVGVGIEFLSRALVVVAIILLGAEHINIVHLPERFVVRQKIMEC